MATTVSATFCRALSAAFFAQFIHSPVPPDSKSLDMPYDISITTPGTRHEAGPKGTPVPKFEARDAIQMIVDKAQSLCS
eukprot:6465536-Amphidinium_carterae.1